MTCMSRRHDPTPLHHPSRCQRSTTRLAQRAAHHTHPDPPLKNTSAYLNLCSRHRTPSAREWHVSEDWCPLRWCRRGPKTVLPVGRPDSNRRRRNKRTDRTGEVRTGKDRHDRPGESIETDRQRRCAVRTESPPPHTDTDAIHPLDMRSPYRITRSERWCARVHVTRVQHTERDLRLQSLTIMSGVRDRKARWQPPRGTSARITS